MKLGEPLRQRPKGLEQVARFPLVEVLGKSHEVAMQKFGGADANPNARRK